jgi:hypothetical protein
MPGLTHATAVAVSAGSVPACKGLKCKGPRCMPGPLVPAHGGEGGIRTHGTRERTTVFETAPFDHSGTSPKVDCVTTCGPSRAMEAPLDPCTTVCTRAVHGARPSGGLRPYRSAVLPIGRDRPVRPLRHLSKGRLRHYLRPEPRHGGATRPVYNGLYSRRPWRSPFGRPAAVPIGCPADRSRPPRSTNPAPLQRSTVWPMCGSRRVASGPRDRTRRHAYGRKSVGPGQGAGYYMWNSKPA